MAAEAEKKKSNSASPGKAQGGAKKKRSSKNRPTSKKSGAGRKNAAESAAMKREEWEYQRNRFIIAIVQFLLAVLSVFIYFLPGENLWRALHLIYRGLFGLFGFMVPVILIYCAGQNVKDRPVYRFKLKTLFICLLVILLASGIYCFQSVGAELGGYFPELQNTFRFSAENVGMGIQGALLGVLLTKLLGAVGGGIVSLILFLIILAITLDALIVDFFEFLKKPARRVGEHLSDRRRIRHEVKEREQVINDAKRKQEREQYVRQEIEKQMSKKHPEIGDDLMKIKNKPFYQPIQLSAEPQEQEKPAKKKKRKDSPQDTSQELPANSPQNAAPEPPQNESFDFNLLVDEFVPEEENTPVPEEIPTVNDIIFEPVPEPKKSKRGKEPVPDFEVTPDDSIIKGHYIKPPFNLLEPQPREEEANISMELNQNGTMLVETLKSFGVQTTIVNICRGPSVTRYELQPASGVKISKITNLADDIAMNLAAIGVRIEAPIPGKSAVGIEVPNKNVSVVKMRNLVESREFQNAKSNLTVALGKDITGRITLADLSRMPHLLIAGSTGSGKSVCINSMLVSLLYKSSPEDVKLLLIDPKVVELGVYNGIPHLLVPVVTDPRKAAGALNWAVNEMLNRYKTFAEYNVRDMHSYNRLVDKQNAETEELLADMHSDEEDRSFEEDEMLAQAQAELGENPDAAVSEEPKLLKKMPQIVIVIDELADLMMAASKEVEESICRLAQMARAAGMHLVIATQRPSVDVITGLIKANVPSRIAFAVKSVVDSRTILDIGGAEKLLGRGDMLFSPIGTSKPIRVQGCYVDDVEIENIIAFIKGSKVVEYDQQIMEEIENNAIADNTNSAGEGSDGEMDPMMEEAIKCVVEAGQASTSMLQRRFRLGYARAGRLIDEMEQLGIVGPHEGAKPRKVLMTYQQWMERNMNH